MGTLGQDLNWIAVRFVPAKSMTCDTCGKDATRRIDESTSDVDTAYPARIIVRYFCDRHYKQHPRYKTLLRG